MGTKSSVRAPQYADTSKRGLGRGESATTLTFYFSAVRGRHILLRGSVLGSIPSG